MTYGINQDKLKSKSLSEIGRWSKRMKYGARGYSNEQRTRRTRRMDEEVKQEG